MKRIAAFVFAFFAVCYLQIADADAQFRRECRYGFCVPGGGPTGTPISNACISTPGTTITFTAQGTGGANTNRISVVSINWSSAGSSELTAVSIGGISMGRAVRATASAAGNNSEIWYVANPTGTSSDIVLTASVALTGATIEVYSLIGYHSVAATTTGTTSVSQAYSNKQLAIAAGSRATNVSTSLSNMTNDFSSACGAGLWGVHASQPLHGNGTLSSSISPTSSTPKIAMVVWQTTACTFPTVAGLLGHWDVQTSVTKSGTNVTAVPDISGNGNNLTGLNNPTWGPTLFNGLAGIQFASASNQGLFNSSFPLGTGSELTLFGVFQMNDPAISGNGDNSRLMSYTASGASHDYDNTASFAITKYINTSTIAWSRNSASILSIPFGYTLWRRMVVTVTSGGSVTVYIDGSATNQSMTGAAWTTNGWLGIATSKLDSGSVFQQWGGRWGEGGVSSVAANATVAGQIDTYLKCHWNIP